MDATTLDGLLSTIDHVNDPVSVQIFTVPEAGALAPFTENSPHLSAVDIIDSVGNLDVDYGPAEATEVQLAKVPRSSRTIKSSDTFSIDPTIANIRVKDVNRLNIPGSFTVHLLKDGERIASTGFFQPTEPGSCKTCQKNAIMHFDFELPVEHISGSKLSVHVEPDNKDIVGDRIPYRMMGGPKIEISLKHRNH
jgi:hypothetical protein